MEWSTILTSPAFLAVVAPLCTLLGAWLNSRVAQEKNDAEKDASVATARLEEKKLVLDQTKSEQDALRLAQEALQQTVATLRETISAQQERIRFIAEEQTRTTASLSETQRQLEYVKMSLHDEQAYTAVLVKHIEDQLPPPPPPRPQPSCPPMAGTTI
ncbi:hypothetical protein ACRQFN_02355 [Actinotignum sp. GS-2025e]|uniref:hypothetical protein n=1 Tax=unclassified Actinotignum TaxID=2632702 RepID=UPI003F471CD7